MKQKIKKIFSEDLPRKEGIGALKGKQVIDWKSSIGYSVKFIYNDIEGEINIIDYDGKYLTIKYLNEKPFKIATAPFLKCQLGKLLGQKTNEFKYKVGQIFKDKKRDLIITDTKKLVNNRGYQKFNEKWYKYTCNKCGWTEGWIMEGNLLKRQGCACCANKVAVLGINTIWDTARWMCDLGVSEEDAKTHTYGSNKKITVKCPDCGKNKIIMLNAIYSQKSISCLCSDKISYPEKFITNILNQIKVKFQTQYSPNWIKPKRYDFYLPDYNMIIETHGIQHYEETNFKLSLKEINENDKLKEKTALMNGIKHYIVINCSYSEFDWTTFNVYKSLKEYFDMSNINFGEAEKFALGNLVKEVCEYWNNKEDWESTYTIAKDNTWGIKSIGCISNYLKKGSKLGWCNYDPKEEFKKSKQKMSKAVKMYDKNGIFLDIFESTKQIEDISFDLFGVKLDHSNISAVCLGKLKTYKGYKFSYEEHNKQEA